MNFASRNHCIRRLVLVVLFFFLFLPPAARSQLISSGYQVKNRKYEMLITDYGYADLALDRRRGFKGREYLSGEWAAAIFYTGGRNPAGPIWFQPQWFFPDWVSNSDFGVDKGFGIADPFNPTNEWCFTVYQSIITNRDLRVTFNYEMIDLGTNETARLAIGMVANSAGGAGANIFSGRYVFRQTYKFANISGGQLNNLKFYQLLHALESGWGVCDNRPTYGGAMSNFRYRFTQQGQSSSFDTRTMETVLHTDTLGVNFNMAPSGYELGLYGTKGVDSHSIGKPSAGVHLSVETDTFNSNDSINPNNTAWVAGAMRFDLGSLAPNATASISALLSIHTTSVVTHPPLNVVVRKTQLINNTYTIDFEDTTRNPKVGYLLRKATSLGEMPPTQWQQMGVGYTINFPQMGWNRFQFPINPGEPKAFFFIQPQIINPP